MSRSRYIEFGRRGVLLCCVLAVAFLLAALANRNPSQDRADLPDGAKRATERHDEASADRGREPHGAGASGPGHGEAIPGVGAESGPVGSGSLRGSVGDSLGTPLVGVLIRVEALPGRAKNPGGASRAETNADGEFRVVGLEPGTYAVTASLDGYLLAGRRRAGPRVEGRGRIHVPIAADQEVGVQLRMQALFVALVSVRFRGVDYMPLARNLFARENLRWPEGLRDSDVDSVHSRLLPASLRDRIQQLRKAEGAKIHLLSCIPVKGWSQTGALSVELKNAKFGAFQLSGSRIRLSKDGYSEVPLTILDAAAVEDVATGRVRIRRADGGLWRGSRRPIAVRWETDGAIFIGTVDPSKRYIESPPIPVGHVRLRVPDRPDPDPKSYVDVTLIADSVVEVELDYSDPPDQVRLKFAYATGAKPGRVDVAILRDGKRRFRRWVKDSRGTGEELVPRDAFEGAGELIIMVRPEGLPWIKTRFTAPQIQAALAANELAFALVPADNG